MKRKIRKQRTRRNRRRLHAESLEQRRLLAVDTWVFDFDNVGTVDLFDTDAASTLEDAFAQNSDGDGNIVSTNNVLGQNNEPPVLDPIGSQSVDELATLTFTATASDTDTPPQTLTFSLSGNVPAGASITTTGDFTWTPTEAQGPQVHTFDVGVFDGFTTTTETISVTVGEVNVDPVLDPVGDKTVDEQSLLTFTATANDIDLPPNALTFSLSGAVPAGAAISAGGVFTWTPTEAQGPGIFTFDVVVNDNGSPDLSDSETIMVTVNEVNSPPVITSDGGGATAAVNAAENQTSVTTVTATDSDIPPNAQTFSISGGADQALFSIGALTGILSFNSAPDFENPTDVGGDGVYDIQVTATDTGVPTQTDVQDIAVTVTDANDAPIITSDGGGATATVNAAENQTAVTTVTASDADLPAQTLTFTITGGADQALFGITAGGVLTFNSAPDFENPIDAGVDGTYDVQVTVTDDGAPNLTDVQDIAVTVTNVNEAPTITSYGGNPTGTDSVQENSTLVENIESTDVDGTVEGAGGLQYSITGGADAGVFGINANTGVLVFNSAPDFENPTDVGGDNVYDVQVTVTDPGGLTDLVDIAVTVTDANDAPVITSDGGGATAAVNAAEDQTAVTTVTGIDQDLPAQTLTFTITGGADQALFGITAGGVLTFNSAPDFENPTDAGADNIYDVQVTVTDNGAPNLTDVQDIAVTVTNVNDAPVITSYGGLPTANDTVLENATFVEDIQSTDPDGTVEGAGGLTYSITGGADSGIFGIIANTGVLVFNSAPDFENPSDFDGDNFYEVQVTVTDPGLLTDVVDITVEVTNVNDPPVITSDGGGATAAINAAENQTAVTTVTATDEDLPAQTLIYAITGGADQALFGITAGGVLTFNAAPDFENPIDAGANGVYDVQVTVTDTGIPSQNDVQDIAVTVTNVNEAPVITSYGGLPIATDTLLENATFVEDIQSTDPEGTPEGAGGLTYSITGGADAGIFGIIANTGVLVFNSAPDFENPADFDSDNFYELQVTVTDPGLLTDAVDITVQVTDVNDNPVITSDGGGATAALNINENSTAVTTGTATDEDQPPQTLTWTITGGADQALFGITAGGVLTFNAAPDFENPTDAGGNNIYDVQITVTDNGVPNQSDVQDIAVTVDNVNEAPVITSYGGLPTANDTVLENATLVENIESTDSDGTVEGAGGLTYSITGGADAGVFGIQSTTGILVFNSAPDFENPGDFNTDNFYEVQVTVTDPTLLTDVVDITVEVTDVNENPVITSDGGGATAALSINENLTAVTTGTATDVDQPAQTLTWTITGGADQALFGITAGGVLTFNTGPDFESPTDAGGNNVYDVQITVTDNGVPNLSDVQDIAITVNDVAVEALPPTAVNDSYSSIGNVGLTVGVNDGVILGTGADNNGGGTITVTAVQGVGANVGSATNTTAVGLGGVTGSVTVATNGSFTYEPAPGFVGNDTFTYEITNVAGSDTATVTIAVSDTVWFIDNSSTGSNKGTLDNPFTSIASFNAAQGAAAPNATDGNTIFIDNGSGAAYLNGITLRNSQILIGEAAGASIAAISTLSVPSFSNSLPATGGAAPLLTTSGAGNDGITLAANNRVRGLDIGNTGGTGIAGSLPSTLFVREVGIGGSGGGVQIFGTGADTIDVVLDDLGASSSTEYGILLQDVIGDFDVTATTGTISTTGKPAIGILTNPASLDLGLTFASVSSAGSDDVGISLVGTTGTFTANGGSISGSTVHGFGVSLGTTNVTYNGTINQNNANSAVIASNNTGGTIDFNGTITAATTTANGINLTSNTGATFTFDGGLDIDTTTGVGFNATGGGTVSSSGSNTIDATGGGTGINIANTALGATNLTFTSVNVSGGANNGIVLSSTGSGSGGLVVGTLGITGITQSTADTFHLTTGRPTSVGNGNGILLNNHQGGFTANGGTISDVADNALDIRNSDDTVLNNVTIVDSTDGNTHSTGNSAIQWHLGSNLTLNNVTIEDIGDNTVIPTGGVNIQDSGIKAYDVSGDLNIIDSVFDGATGYVFANAVVGSEDRAVEVDNDTGTDLDVTVTGSTFRDFDFQALNLRHIGGSLDASIGGPTAGDVNTFQNINGAAVSTGPSVQSATGNVHGLEVENNQFTSVGIAVEVFSARGNSIGGVEGTHAFIEDNTITGTISDAFRLHAFAIDGGTPVAGSNNPIFRAYLSNNTVNGLANLAPGTGGGSVFFVAAEDNADSDVTINNHPNLTGLAGGGTNPQLALTTQNQRSGDLDLVFTNNTFSNFPNSSTNSFGFAFLGSDLVTNSPQTQTAVRFGGNNWNNHFGGFFETVFIDTGSFSTMDVEGYAGGPNDDAALAAHLNTVDSNVATFGFLINTGNVTGNAASVTGPTAFPTTPLLAAGGQGPGADSIDASELSQIVKSAISRFHAAGISAAQQNALANVKFNLVDLSDGVLGQAAGDSEVFIDIDAAGWGWFVDATPDEDSEFDTVTADTQRVATDSSEASGRIDLLTVVMHELGHILGETHTEAPDLMAEDLPTSTRRLLDSHDHVQAGGVADSVNESGDRHALDVNGDGIVSAADALFLINAMSDKTQSTAALDTNGDGRLTPSDAIGIINFLSQQKNSTAPAASAVDSIFADDDESLSDSLLF